MTITFTRTEYRELKAAYRKAVTEGVATFTFKDTDLLTSYAKYLLAFLETKFKS